MRMLGCSPDCLRSREGPRTGPSHRCLPSSTHGAGQALPIGGFHVRKMMVGLLGVAVVASLTNVASSAAAQIPAQPLAQVPAADVAESVPSDDLPSAEGLKERELREEAVKGVLNGTLTAEKINGSTVVKLGSSDRARARGASLFRHK